jgi:hypothetical protein
MTASEYNRSEIVKLLLGQGARFDVKNKVRSSAQLCDCRCSSPR